MKLIIAALALAAVCVSGQETTTADPRYNTVSPHAPLFTSNGMGVFRNPHCGKVLEAIYEKVKLEDFTGFPSQMWEPSYVGSGKFRMKNLQAGLFLDIQGDAVSNAHVVVRKPQEGNPNQEWQFNDDRTITSSVGNLALTIRTGNTGTCRSGSMIVLARKSGSEGQKFIYQANNH